MVIRWDISGDPLDDETAAAQQAADRLTHPPTHRDPLGIGMPGSLDHGHPFFYTQLQEEAELHTAKNHDYASGGDPLGNFNRVAAIVSMYPGLEISDAVVVALMHLLKQLDAVLWGLAQQIEHKVEGLHPRLTDISVLAKLARCLLRDGGR